MADRFLIRRFRPADAGPIARLFHETVHHVNLGDYTPEQVNAWSAAVEEAAAWSAKLGERSTFVAVIGETVVGFADVEPDGHFDHLFVHHQHQRQGIAQALAAEVEAEARRLGVGRLFTEASLTARGFFLRQGYRVLREQTVVRRGVELTNFAMEKRLD